MQKVSVIVPVYNGEKYLEECLQSVLNQTYQQLEIIIINDGSIDATASIIESFRTRDSRIRVLHKKQNEGISAARNSSLEMVTGDYVVFVDSDDWVDPNHIEDLYGLITRTDSQIAIANFTQYNTVRKSFNIHLSDADYYEKVMTPQEWFQYQYGKGHNLSLCFTVPWTKMYQASLFERIIYPDIEFGEDDATTWKLYLLSDRIAYMNRSSYVYRINDNSMTQVSKSAEIFSTGPVLERLSLLSMLGFDIQNEINAFKWRAKIGQKEALDNGDMKGYKNLSFQLDILKKYGKDSLE